MCGFYQLVSACHGWDPNEDEPKENQEMTLPGAWSGVSTVYSGCLRVLRNALGMYPAFFGSCISAEGEAKLTWRSSAQRQPGLLSPGKYTWDVCCPCTLLTGVRSALLSLMTFLRVLTEKSHNGTPKANVLLVKVVNSLALQTAAAAAVHPGALPRRRHCLPRLHTELC